MAAMLIPEQEPPWWKDTDRRSIFTVAINSLVTLFVGGAVVIYINVLNAQSREELVLLSQDLKTTDLTYEIRNRPTVAETDRVVTEVHVKNIGTIPARDVRIMLRNTRYPIDGSASKLLLVRASDINFFGNSGYAEIQKMNAGETVIFRLEGIVDDADEIQNGELVNGIDITCTNCRGLAERGSEPNIPSGSVVQVVRFGDTLKSISEDFGKSVQDIMRTNQIVDAADLYVGQRLIISTNMCGGTSTRRHELIWSDRFARAQGVSVFTRSNTEDLMLGDRVSALAIDITGLWVGNMDDDSGLGGLSHYDKSSWANCVLPGDVEDGKIHDIVFDGRGRVWISVEQGGVSMFDGTRWTNYTIEDGLPSNDTFGLTIGDDGVVWVATWAGVGRFDGRWWHTEYSGQEDTIFDPNTHSVAFDGVGNVWVGHIYSGISFRHGEDQRWEHLTTASSGIAGDRVRDIEVHTPVSGEPEAVWIATNDGGLSRYISGVWTTFTDKDGLPSNEVRDIEFDRYSRVWAATSRGVAYFDGTDWVTYHTYDALSLAIGSDCLECPFSDAEHVWTGTANGGLTHSRLPLDSPGVEIVTVEVPDEVEPGEEFFPEITVKPVGPYTLRGSRGDFLANVDVDDFVRLRLGAPKYIPVYGDIKPNASHTFRPEEPFTAPLLPEGVDEMEFVSHWRVWMHTRYVGPRIVLAVTVRRATEDLTRP